MQKLILEALTQLTKLWQTLEVSQKITIVLLSLVVFLSLFFIGKWGTTPDYEILFSNLDSSDAAQIVGKLTEAKVPYKLDNGGNTVLVPKNNVYEMRIQMASQGLPKGSGVGFEIFDNFKLGATDFTQKLNYQRALQTELERTIMKIAQIRQARVHIAIPDEQIFADEKQETTASVVLDLMGAGDLNAKQIQGIVHLVASAIKGLKPENITVIDTNGNLLYSKDDSTFGAGGGYSTTQLEAQAGYEKIMEKRIQSMLVSVIGANKSVVRVNAVLDFDQQKVDSEVYEPAEEPIARSEKSTEESYSGDSSQGPGGMPGTDTNVPGGGGTAAAGGAGNSNKYSRLEEVKNYEITKHIKHEVKAPGSVKKLSVAVLLDRMVSAEQTAAITQAVKAAVGIDETRGDSLVIKNIAFDKTAMEQSQKAIQQGNMMSYGVMGAKGLGLALLVIFFLVWVRGVMRRVSSMSPQTVGPDKTAELAQLDQEIQAREKEIELELERLERLSMPTAEAQKKIAMQKQLEKMATKETDDFIKLLRSWLAED